jgi:hypothetical protein
MAKRKSTVPIYTGLDAEELKALSIVNGEAVRVYLALSMRCFGKTYTGFASKETLIRDMGMDHLLFDEETGKAKNWLQPFNRKLKELEDAGLLDRGKKRFPWSKGNPWTLTLKKKILEKRMKQKGSVKKQKGSETRTKSVSKENQLSSDERTEKVQHNNKLNNKNNNKLNNISYININEYEEYEREGSMYRRLPEDTEKRMEILHILETKDGYAVLWYFHLDEIVHWWSGFTGGGDTVPQGFQLSHSKITQFIMKWSKDGRKQ